MQYTYFVSFLAMQSSRWGKRELVALLFLISSCHVAVIVLCLFLTVLWVGVQCVIVALPGHTHLRFAHVRSYKRSSDM